MIILEYLLNQAIGECRVDSETDFLIVVFRDYSLSSRTTNSCSTFLFLLFVSANCFKISSTLGSLCCSSHTFSSDMDMFPSSFLVYRQHWTSGGILERASGALFSFPFLYSTMKSNLCNLRAHLTGGFG